MSDSKSDDGSFIKNNYFFWVWTRLLRSKRFYLIVMVTTAAIYAGIQYKRFLIIPEEDSALRVEYFNLGSHGEKPFYQTDKDVELMNKLIKMRNKRSFSMAMGFYYDIYRKRYRRGYLLTQCVRVNENQYPDIYEMVKDASEILGVEPTPSIYLGKTPGTNLVVTNYRSPSIIIGSDFLWAFTPEELRFLLARSVAHIRCEHLFLLDMIKGAQAVANTAAPNFITRIVMGGLGTELMNWYREGQISADRAGLVVVGNIESAVNALVKLNIGTSVNAYYGNVNVEEYVRQLEDINDDAITSTAAAMSELRNYNPFLTIRVRHLWKWYENNRYLFQ